MHESAVRFAFGPRPPVDVDEEAPNPLPDQHERKLQQDTIMTDIMESPPLPSSPPLSPSPTVDDHNENRDLANPDKEWDPDDEYIARPSLEQVSYNPCALPTNADHSCIDPRTIMLENIGSGTNRADSLEVEVPLDPQSVTAPGSVPGAGANMNIGRRLLPQPEYGEAFLDLLPDERQAIDYLLSPVRDSLLRLRATTPESLPDYHSHTRTRNHAQVLRARLTDVAAHIQRILRESPEHARGELELRLCRVIATGYWPLPVASTTHLDIQRIYRNAAFRLQSREQLQAAEARSREWAAQNQERQRQRGSFRDVPVQSEMVNHLAAANVAQAAWQQQQQQQERYRSLAALEQDITAELQDTIAKREEREKSEKYLGLISGSALRWEEKMANQKAKTKEKADSDEEMARKLQEEEYQRQNSPEMEYPRQNTPEMECKRQNTPDMPAEFRDFVAKENAKEQSNSKEERDQDSTAGHNKQTALCPRAPIDPFLWQNARNEHYQMPGLSTGYRPYSTDPEVQFTGEQETAKILVKLAEPKREEERRQVEDDAQLARAIQASMNEYTPRQTRNSRRRPQSCLTKNSEDLAFEIEEEMDEALSKPGEDRDLDTDRERYHKDKRRKSGDEDKE